jgi:hypothetical protein
MHIQPLSDSRDRTMGFLRLFLSHLQHKTNRTFTKLVGVLPGSGHDSILSKVGVSTETGAVHSWVIVFKLLIFGSVRSGRTGGGGLGNFGDLAVESRPPQREPLNQDDQILGETPRAPVTT